MKSLPDTVKSVETKLDHVVAIVAALAIVFGLVGAAMRPSSMYPMIILVFTSLFWCSTNIIRGGVKSFKELIKKDEPPTDDSKDA